MTGKIRAPWTAEQVKALNEHQRSGRLHPFTCGYGQAGLHESGIALVAYEDGWRCPHAGCDYRQGWAHAFMAEVIHRA